MRPTIINCSGCGSPLGGLAGRVAPGALVPCLYCGALLHFAGADLAPTVERRITSELVERIREAALRGGRSQAIALCVQEAGIQEDAAGLAVDDVIKHVARHALITQPLRPVGWLMFVFYVLLAVAAMGGLVVPAFVTIPWGGTLVVVVSGVALAFAAFALSIFGRAAITSVRFALATRAPARILHSMRVGPTGGADGSLVYSLSINVTPPSGAPFHARLVVPVRTQSLHKVAVGQELLVRFADGGAWVRVEP